MSGNSLAPPYLGLIVACRESLFRSRWRDRFQLPALRERGGYGAARRLSWECSACRYQVSVTAGSMLHRTRTPTAPVVLGGVPGNHRTPGISALQLQRQLGLTYIRELGRSGSTTGVRRDDKCLS